MRKIICRRCGAEIDASGGVCPNCGAVYYILPEEETPAAETTEIPGDETRIWSADDVINEVHAEQTRQAGQTSPRNTQNAQTTRRTASNQPQTTQRTATTQTRGQSASPQRAQTAHSAANSQRRTTQQPQQTRRPTTQQQASRQRSRRAMMDEDEAYYPQQRRNKRGGRSKGFAVAAVALLALVVVIICAMSGAFSFSSKTETVYMPNLVGSTLSSAQSVLESYDLDLVIVTSYEDSDETKDVIIKQDIKEGKKLTKKEEISLVLSNGEGKSDSKDDADSEKVSVPDVSNMTYDQAREMLERYGLNISRTDGVYSDTIDEGRVVTQSPAKGTELSEGSTVIVTLSNGVAPTDAPVTYTVTVTAGKGGSISPKGQVEIEDGGSKTFSIMPDEGYEVREVKVDGTDVGAVESYTFTNVTANHTIYAVFQLKVEETTAPTTAPTEDPTPTQPTVVVTDPPAAEPDPESDFGDDVG